MKPVVEFVKTTLLGGVLFLIPLVLTIVILREAVQLAGKALRPIEKLIPDGTFLGIAAEHIVAATALLMLCLAAGLMARTPAGQQLNDRIERMVLRKMPGFTLVKSVAGGVAGVPKNSDVGVVLARIDEVWMLAFVIERHASGLLTVFVPSAPTPTAGSLYFMTEDQLRPLDVPVSQAIQCIMQLGVGSRQLLERLQLPSQSPA